MSVLAQAGSVASILGDALEFANALTQPQVTITEKKPIPGLTFTVPVPGQSTVILEVVNTEDMTMGVEITDHPVADLGAAIDYVAKVPPEFIITGIVSNRNLNVLSDPIGFALSAAGAAAPEISSAINQAVELGGQFFDLGGDEIDAKLKQFYYWMNNAVYVYPLGVRLDINKWIQDSDLINWLIKDVKPVHDLDNGDGVGVEITFKGMIGLNQSANINRGGILQQITQASRTLGDLNPFGGI